MKGWNSIVNQKSMHTTSSYAYRAEFYGLLRDAVSNSRPLREAITDLGQDIETAQIDSIRYELVRGEPAVRWDSFADFRIDMSDIEALTQTPTNDVRQTRTSILTHIMIEYQSAAERLKSGNFHGWVDLFEQSHATGIGSEAALFSDLGIAPITERAYENNANTIGYATYGDGWYEEFYMLGDAPTITYAGFGPPPKKP